MSASNLDSSAPSPPRPVQPGDFYRRLGGGLFAREAWLLGDESAARRAADELFLRYVIRHGDAERRPPTEEEGEWAWIYRVATNDALQRLPDDGVPGGAPSPASSSAPPAPAPAPLGRDPEAAPIRPPGRRRLPRLAELRRLDELHANARVLADFDGLSVEEIVAVLGPLPERLRQTLASFAPSGDGLPPASAAAATGDDASPSVAASSPAPPAPAAVHPSRLALDRDRGQPAIAAHLRLCGDCAEAAARTARWREAFAAAVGPDEVARMARAIALVEGKRRARGRKIRQAIIVTASMLAVCALALLVARPRTPSREEIPYAGVKGASRVKASGIQIYLRGDDGTRALDPEASVHPGDRLVFRVRVERPRFLELRVRQGHGGPAAAGSAAIAAAAGHERRVYPPPAGGATVAPRVTAGQVLDEELTVAAEPGPLVVIGRFADHPFALDEPAAGPDVEIVPARIDVVSTAAPP